MTGPVTGQDVTDPVTNKELTGPVIGQCVFGPVTSQGVTSRITGQCMSGPVTGEGLVARVYSYVSGHRLPGLIPCQGVTVPVTSHIGPTYGPIRLPGSSASLVVPSRTILRDHNVRLDLDTTFSALHHTMDRGRVPPPPSRHKAGRHSQAPSPGNRNQNRGRRLADLSASGSSSCDSSSSGMSPHHF